MLNSSHPEKQAANVFALELKLAKASSTATQKRDVDAMYNLYTLSQLSATFPGFDWNTYFKKTGLAKAKDLVISQPKFIKEALKQLNGQSLDVWRSYLTFHTLVRVMDKLPPAYEQLKFDFYGRILQGAKQPEPRYRRVIGLCQSLLAEPLGQLFVEAHFDESAKRKIYDLVGHLQKAFRNRLQQLSWMSAPTKKRALEKLNAFLPLLGYPDTWKDYSSLDIGKSYVANYLATMQFEWRRDTARLSKPVDRHEWLMSPALVNACYWQNANSITFPAGILQPPFFDATGDFAANYGAIGVAIGHEMTHGFDDKGSKFDKEGNIHPWWGKEDRQTFLARAKELEEQYSSYKVLGRKVNGKLTLGENIADLGGLLLAFDALQQELQETGNRGLVDGFTPEQRFFMAYARVWRSTIRSELALRLLMADPHLPGELRTNGVVTNCDAFYEAFDCKPGDKLYKPVRERVRIW